MVANGLGLGFIPLTRLTANSNIKYFALSPKMIRLHAVLIKSDAKLEDYRELIGLAARYYKKHISSLSLSKKDAEES